MTELTSRETEVDGYWVFPCSWLCLALAVRKKASLSDPLSGPIPKSGVRGLLQQGKGSLKENSMGDKSEDQRGSQTLAPPRHQTAPLSSLPCFQLQSGREMVRIMTLSIRQTFISSTLSLSCFFGMWQVPLDWWNGRKKTGWKGMLKFLDVMRIYQVPGEEQTRTFPTVCCGLRDLKPSLKHSVLLHFFSRKNSLENLYTTRAAQTTIPIRALLDNENVTNKN